MQNCVYLCVNFSEKSVQTSSKGNYHLTKIKKTKSHLIANITFNHNLKKKVWMCMYDINQLSYSLIIVGKEINTFWKEGYTDIDSLSLTHTYTPMLHVIKWSWTLSVGTVLKFKNLQSKYNFILVISLLYLLKNLIDHCKCSLIKDKNICRRTKLNRFY